MDNYVLDLFEVFALTLNLITLMLSLRLMNANRSFFVTLCVIVVGNGASYCVTKCLFILSTILPDFVSGYWFPHFALLNACAVYVLYYMHLQINEQLGYVAVATSTSFLVLICLNISMFILSTGFGIEGFGVIYSGAVVAINFSISIGTMMYSIHLRRKQQKELVNKFVSQLSV